MANVKSGQRFSSVNTRISSGYNLTTGQQGEFDEDAYKRFLNRNKTQQQTASAVSTNEINAIKGSDPNKTYNLGTATMSSADSVISESDKYISKIAKKTGYSEKQVKKYLEAYNKGKWDSTNPKYYEANKKFEEAGYPVYKAVKEVNKYSSELGEKKAGKLERAVSTAITPGVALVQGVTDYAEGLLDAGLQLGSSEYNPGMWIATGETPWSKDKSKIKEYQNIAQELIQEQASNRAFKGINESVNEGSLFDSESGVYNLFRQTGAMLPSVATTMSTAGSPTIMNAAGLITNAPMSFGKGVEEAYNGEGTRAEATLYGILNTVIETGTELLSGGVGGVLNVGPIDDLVKDKIINNISSKYGKILADYVLSAGFEGLEETLGDLFQPIAQKLTYLSEEDLGKLYSNQNYLEDFVSGALSSLLLQGGNTIVQNQIMNNESKKITKNLTEENKAQKLNELIQKGFSENQAITIINKQANKLDITPIQPNIEKIGANYVINGKQIAENKLNDEIKRLESVLDTVQTPSERARLNEAIFALKAAQSVQPVTEEVKTETKVEEQKPAEIKTEQPEKVVKDTQNDQEQLRNTIQENEAKLEEIKSNKSQNETKVKKLEEELKNLQDKKIETVKDKQLEKRIASARRSVDELQQRYTSEQATYGVTPDTLRLGQELSKARNRLQELLSQQKETTSMYNNETNDKINEMKKQMEDLKAQDNTQEIEQLEKEIEENKRQLDESLSQDEIGADIEYSDNSYEDDTLEVPTNTVTILDEMPKEEVKLREKINQGMNADKKLWRKFKSKIVNSWSYLEYLGRKTKNTKLMPSYNYVANSGSLAQYNIKFAQTDLYGNWIGRSVQSIFNEIKNNTPEDMNVQEYTNLFQTYMLARRQGTQEEGRAISLGKDTTRESALETANEIEKEHPEFKQYQQEILKYEENLRKMMVEAGLISQETKELLEMLYPEYVKIERNVKGRGYNFTRNGQIVGIKSPIQQSTGSELDINPLEETLGDQTIAVIKACARNKFANELYNSLGGVNSNIRKENIKNGIVTYKTGESSLVFYKDGKQKSVPIDNEIKELIAPKYEEEGNIQKALATTARWQRNLITNLNPFFAVTNVFKDAGDAVINSKHGALYLKNYPIAWKKMITNSTEWQQYKALGGLDTTYFDYGKGFRETSKIGKVVGAPVSAMEWLGNNLEQVTRFAEYLASLDAGESAIEAMYNANEVTVNFKKGGTTTKKLSRYGWNYLNASILGTSKFFENIQNNKGKAFVKLATKAAFFSIAPAILNELLLHGDKDYDELEDSVKNSNYIFKIGGKLIKIPKGRLNSIISTPFRQFASGDPMSLKEYRDFALDQIGPNNPLTSNAIYPLIQVSLGFNGKNYFGNPIIPARYKGKSLEEQYKDPSVTNASKALSKWAKKTFGWNISPFQLDYLADQNLGFIWDIVEPNLTDEVDKQVWETKFVVDSVKSNKYTNELFNNVNKYENASNEDDSLRYKYYYSEMAKTWDYYKEIRTINADNNLSQKEKEKKTTEIRKQINNLAKNAIEAGKSKIKNKEYNDEKYKQLGTKLWKYNKKENKWEAVRTNSNEYKYMTEY